MNTGPRAHRGAEQAVERLAPNGRVAILMEKVFGIADVFEIWNNIGLPGLADSDFSDFLGGEGALLRGGNGGDTGRRQADDTGTDHIQAVGVTAGQQTTDGPGRTGGGTIALHSHYGIHYVQLGRTGEVQVHDHAGEIHGVGVAIVVFRFDTAGYYAVHIFDGAGHAHHAVGFQLAAVDDSIGVIQIGGIFEVVSNSCFRKMGLPHLKILIEVCAVSLRFRRAAPLVDAAKIGGIVHSARTIANDDRSAASDQHFTKGT